MTHVKELEKLQFADAPAVLDELSDQPANEDAAPRCRGDALGHMQRVAAHQEHVH
jgi:hypothetical protein